jgi:hypothetical protein
MCVLCLDRGIVLDGSVIRERLPKYFRDRISRFLNQSAFKDSRQATNKLHVSARQDNQQA